MSVLRLGRRAMGTFFEILVVGASESHLRSAAEEALGEIERLEDQLSLFLPTSEIARINALAHAEALPVESGLYDLLTRAVQLTGATDGAFDVTIAPLMEAWGFRGEGARDLGAARRACGVAGLRLEAGTIRFLQPGLRLDLGAIGKGYALDRAAARLRALGVECALLHGGRSSVYAMGAPPGESGWTLGLVDPRDDEHRLGTIRLRDRALSISSSLGRVVQHGSERIGHVIDPRTGRPVPRPGAWAVAPSAADTDALSTAFLVGGAALARTYVGAHPEAGAVVVDHDVTAIGLDPSWAPSKRRASGLDRRTFLQGAAAAAAAFSVGLPAREAAADEPPRQVKVGVVGVGEQGRLLLGQLVRLKGVRVPAVCDTDKAALARCLKIAGRDVETYADLAYMLEEEALDALVVATPTHAHADAAVAALAAGLHVYCEAPLARTVEDCRRIAEAERKSAGLFQTGHQRRTSRLYPHALMHIQSGAIGDVVQVRASWNRKQSWRRAVTDKQQERRANWRLYRELSGGLLLEHGSHVLDLVHWCTGVLPEAVTGFGSLQRWKDGRDVDDTVQVVLRYPGGMQVGYAASLLNSYGGERELIVGDGASILCMDQHEGLLFKEADTVAAGWEQYAKSQMLGKRRGIILDPEATKYVPKDKGERVGPEADKADYFAALEAFLRSVRGGPKPICGVREGLRAAVTAIRAEEALSAGQVYQFTKKDFEV